LSGDFGEMNECRYDFLDGLATFGAWKELSFIWVLCGSVKKTADPQTAHLVFADSQPYAQKPKRANFSRRSDKKFDN
jgi:hypothetical protein